MPVGTRARPPPARRRRRRRGDEIAASVELVGVGRRRGGLAVSSSMPTSIMGLRVALRDGGAARGWLRFRSDARLDGSRDDRPRPGTPRDRRDRHAASPTTSSRSSPKDPTWSSTRPRGAGRDGRLRDGDAHPLGAADRRSRPRRLSVAEAASADAGLPATPHRREPRTFPWPATRSAPTAVSSPSRCPTSRTSSTTATSTCRPSRSWPGAGTPRCSPTPPRRRGTHRALDDIKESIGELRHYRSLLLQRTSDA